MKKFILICVLTLLVAIFAACGGGGSSNENSGNLRVIATIFPPYDFIRAIAGERVELSMLISPGAESHGFEPTPRDIISINDADLLVYIGGHNDDWVARIVASLERDDDLRTVALMDFVDTVMAEHDHDDEHDHHHGGCSCCGPSHGAHYDKHVWTCPQNAIQITQALTEILAEMDAENADFFRENARRFISELTELDEAFREVVAGGVRRTIVFGDRFPFQYFVDTYGLTAHAAFHGCSVETHASPATIARLITVIEDEEIPVIFHIEFSSLLVANVLTEATGARILEMHSLHNLSPADFSAGVTYLEIMWRNVEKLREALH